MSCDVEVKTMILNWLKKNPSHNEIADKIVEVMNETHKGTIENHQLVLKEALFKELMRPVEIPKTRWHGLW